MSDKSTYLFVKKIEVVDKLGHPITFGEYKTISTFSEEDAWEELKEYIRLKYPKRRNYEEELKKWKITKEDIF